MPVIKSAIKKLRRDKKREKENAEFMLNLEKALKAAKKTKGAKDISHAFSLADKAVKKHLVHKNKAARLKSSLSTPASKVKTETAPTKSAPTPKTAPAKAAKKAPAKRKTASKKAA